MEKYNVYISYALKDQIVAKRLVLALTESGLSTYLPDRTKDEVTILEHCDMILVISTVNTLTDRSVESEVRAVNHFEIKKLELKLDPSDSSRAIGHLFGTNAPVTMSMGSENFTSLTNACKTILSGKEYIVSKEQTDKINSIVTKNQNKKIVSEINLYIILSICFGVVLSGLFLLFQVYAAILLAPFFFFQIKIADLTMDIHRKLHVPLIHVRAHKNRIYTGFLILYILLFLSIFAFPILAMFSILLVVVPGVLMIGVFAYLQVGTAKYLNQSRKIDNVFYGVKTEYITIFVVLQIIIGIITVPMYFLSIFG